MSSMKLTRCYLLGHKIGKLNDSGYPVCEWCGCHSYYQTDDFYKGAILMRPIWFLQRKFHLLKYKALNSFRRKFNSDLPF